MATATKERPDAGATRIEDDQLVPGVKLAARFKGQRYKASVVKAPGDGVLIRFDRRTFSSLSAAAQEITGHAMNGRVFWHIV